MIKGETYATKSTDAFVNDLHYLELADQYLNNIVTAVDRYLGLADQSARHADTCQSPPFALIRTRTCGARRQFLIDGQHVTCLAAATHGSCRLIQYSSVSSR